MKKVYLDYNATTPVLPEVLNVMMPFFSKKFGNPSSTHSLGREAASAMKNATKHIMHLIAAENGEIIFTSGGSAANKLALTELTCNSKKKRIISSKIEHSSTYETCQDLKKHGFELTYLDVDHDGLIDVEALDQALDDDVALVSLLLVNNETGTIQDFESIREVVKKYKVPLHYDAVQAAGKIPLDVNSLGASLLSLSAHKIYGPKGIGVLYSCPEIALKPLSGTYNIPGIAALGAACEIARGRLDTYMDHCRKMRNYLENGIVKAYPAAIVNGSRERRVCNTANISFPGFSGSNLSKELDRRGIAVSTGAACDTESDEASRVLKAMQVSEQVLFGALRFSVGEKISKNDIDYVIEQLAKILDEKTEALGGSKIINL